MIRFPNLLLLTAMFVGLGGCAAKNIEGGWPSKDAEIAFLRAQVVALKTNVVDCQQELDATAGQRAQVRSLELSLEDCQQSLADGSTETALPPAEREEIARSLYDRIEEELAQGNVEEARSLLDTFMSEYPGGSMARTAQRLHSALEVVGQKAPSLEVEQWFGGEEGSWGEVTLVVFFEPWCSHCQREVPSLNAKYLESYQAAGLTLLGLTRLTRGSTEQSLRDFISEKGLGFPIAKEDGAMTRAFAVIGIPAAAIVHDGTIVWRGHPSVLPWAWLDTLLAP